MRFSSPQTKLLLAALWLLLPAAASADVKPHALISEGMVLQQGREVKIWGTADKGEKVAVSFRGQDVSATASDDGKWLVQLNSKEAGGPFPLTIAGSNTITLKNVLVGEVWVCSGQSNMWWPVASRAGSKDLQNTENPSIRLFNVPQRLADSPSSDVAGQWAECGPSGLVQFSAVAYYFGRELQKSQHVPIGLIHASYGGSGVEQWISSKALAEDPHLNAIRERRAREAEESVKKLERLKPEIERYQAAVALAKKNGTEPPPPPRGMNLPAKISGRLYNGMIAPLMPFAIRGAIWYQGEANVSRAADYRSQFATLISSWRREWGEGEFPFLFVQLAPHLKIVDQPQESNWAELREAQLRTSQTIPNTGMAVITDWGHESDIHVKQKIPVGERLALVARALVYGEKLAWSGPLYKGMSIEGNKVALTFTHAETGLTTKRLVLEDVQTDSKTGQKGGALHVAAGDAAESGVPLQGFTIAGENREFFTGQAEIKGDTVVVSSPQVEKPVAVRYGWADYPIGNLFNKEGLPASPFRTDDWPLSAKPKVAGR